MEATFILALLSHGYKVRASTLYHLLKGKRTSSVLIYGFLYDCLRFIGWWPTISEQAYFQFLEKLSKAKQIQYHEETNEIQLTKEGQLFLKEHHFSLLDYPAIDLYRFGRSLFTLKRRQCSKTWLKHHTIRGCGCIGIGERKKRRFLI